jgi:hypothetical protein
MSKRKPAEIYTFLTILVKSYDVRSEIGINYSLKGSLDLVSDEAAVFESSSHLTIFGECIAPKERAGDSFEATIYGQRATRRNLKVKDIRKRDVYERPIYKTVRGLSIPVYNVPSGVAVLERRRSDHVWSAWVACEPELVTDMLIVLTTNQRTYLWMHEKRFERRRWLQSVALQTNDPNAE